MTESSTAIRKADSPLEKPSVLPQQLVAKTADGLPVYDWRLPLSHTAGALRAEAIAQINFGDASYAKHEVDLGRPISYCSCVETADGSEILYARRTGQPGLTRFVLGRSYDPTSIITVVLKRNNDDPSSLVVVTTYAGVLEPEPWESDATDRSVEFWSTHALCWNGHDIEPESLTLIPPSWAVC